MSSLRNPRLSVIIPNYNYGRFFKRLARSLSLQTIGLDVVELILVDDGSTDDSLEQARHFETIRPARFQVLTSGHDGRPGNVRNRGLAEASGDYLLCLDPDDLLVPGYMAACIAHLSHNPEFGLAYTDFTMVEDGSPRDIHLPEFDPALLATQNILAPTAVMSRPHWEKTQSYRTDTDYEDWDLWIQFAALGFMGIRIRDLAYVHMVHGNNYSFSARQNDAASKACIVMENQHFFPAAVRHWARSLLAGEPWAIPFPRGIIPTKKHVEKLLNSVKSLSTNERE